MDNRPKVSSQTRPPAWTASPSSTTELNKLRQQFQENSQLWEGCQGEKGKINAFELEHKRLSDAYIDRLEQSNKVLEKEIGLLKGMSKEAPEVSNEYIKLLVSLLEQEESKVKKLTSRLVELGEDVDKLLEDGKSGFPELPAASSVLVKLTSRLVELGEDVHKLLEDGKSDFPELPAASSVRVKPTVLIPRTAGIQRTVGKQQTAGIQRSQAERDQVELHKRMQLDQASKELRGEPSDNRVRQHPSARPKNFRPTKIVNEQPLPNPIKPAETLDWSEIQICSEPASFSSSQRKIAKDPVRKTELKAEAGQAHSESSGGLAPPVQSESSVATSTPPPQSSQPASFSSSQRNIVKDPVCKTELRAEAGEAQSESSGGLAPSRVQSESSSSVATSTLPPQSSSSVGSITSTLQSVSSDSIKGMFMAELERCNIGLQKNENLTKQMNDIKSLEKNDKDVTVLKVLKEAVADLSDCVEKDAVEEIQYNAVKSMRLQIDEKVSASKRQLERLLRNQKKDKAKARKQ